MTVLNPLDTSALLSVTLLVFLSLSTTTLRCRTLEPSKPSSRLISLVGVRVTSTGKRGPQLGGYMNGSAPQTPSKLSPVTTFMIILANTNLVAPSSWGMGRSLPQSLLLGLTPPVWAGGHGLLFQVGLDSLHASSVLTVLVTPPLPKPTVSEHSTAPTS